MALLSAFRRRPLRETAGSQAQDLPPAVVPAVELEGPAPIAADSTFDMIEEDLGRVRRAVEASAVDMSRAVEAAAEDADAVVADADRLAVTIQAAHGDVDAMRRAFGEIASAGEEIDREIAGARSLAEEAQAGAARAGSGVRELDEAIVRIERVVDLIAKVARQTTLLALNATIEAERAGSAGRGFAVVASEVKSLSVETQRATDEINANIAALQKAARHSVASVEDVVGTIGRLAPGFAAVSAAVTRQGDVIADAAAISERTRRAVDEAVQRAGDMKARSSAVAEGVAGVRTAASGLAATADGNTRRLGAVLRQTRAGDRRSSDRFPAFLPVTLSVAGRTHSGETVDISEGGLLVRTAGGEIPAGAAASVEIAGSAPLPARVVARSALGLHLAFGSLDEAARGGIASRVANARAEYEVAIDRAKQAAARISQAFEDGIARGEIGLEALFDTAYRPIAGTDPVQVETPALAFLDRVLQPIQEQLLATDQKMAFCAAVDRNGWLPVHNLVFSKPQRPGDPVWNTANCRNRRIFDDRAGLAAARNTRPFLVQAYQRDMGGGVTVLMKEVDAPITVAGRHWGGFRTAYKA